MDSSKFPQSSDECSSSESGWTAYIASPYYGDDQDDDQDHSKYEAAEDDEEEAESDDSMASDATSGPKGYGLQHAKNENERRHGGKKEHKKEDKKQHAETIKAAKDKADSASRSKKR